MPLYDSILIAGGNGMLAYAIKQTLAAHGHKFSSIDMTIYIGNLSYRPTEEDLNEERGAIP